MLRLSYRPDVDGLRAIAIISVFIFHLNHEFLPGGFVGVDVFFVISGYLITSIIYNDLEVNKFSFITFYQRRIARIAPAFFTVALATITGSYYIYTSQDFASAGANLLAATLSIANLKYMLQGNYFDISPDAQPFLHYWSLSVEEQFYFIFPLFIFLIFRYAYKYLALSVAVLLSMSLLACIFSTYVKPVWAFYLLPTRLWELCSGSLLAIKYSQTNRPHLYFIKHLPTLGLIIIGLSIFLIHESPSFPGWQAIFPVIGAVAIIFPRNNSNDWVKRFLSCRLMVNIGKMSYSLYL